MKLFRNNPNYQTEGKERFGYYLYFTGQNAIYGLVTTFLTTYLLFLGIDPVKTAAVMLAVKIWDAINDAIFGVIFDSIKFKSGKKYIPWLRISTLAIPIATVLIFIIPQGSSEGLKLAWFAIAYLLWDTAYTLCDVPIFGIVTAMTDRIDERTSILSYKSIWGAAGNGLAYIIATVLISEQVGSNFTVVAIMIAVFALATMLPVCFTAKERIKPLEEEQFTIRRMLQYLVKNKYLLIHYLGILFYSGLMVGNGFKLFVSYYLFHNSLFSLLIMAITVVPSLIMALLVPRMVRRFNKRTVYLACTAALLVSTLAMWAAGYDNFVVHVILCAIQAIPFSVTGVMMFMFTPDCAEYGKFKTGIEAKGITFALQTFMAKLTSAISGALGLFILGWFGWKSVQVESFQELENLAIQQTPAAINGLWLVYSLIPALGYLIAFIIWTFYRLPDKDVQIMTDCNSGKITREEADVFLSKKY